MYLLLQVSEFITHYAQTVSEYFVCFYVTHRNKNEKVKELTSEERKEIKNKENARSDSITSLTGTTYTPKREHTLKIHVDSTPVIATAETTGSESTPAE